MALLPYAPPHHHISSSPRDGYTGSIITNFARVVQGQPVGPATLISSEFTLLFLSIL